MITSKDTPEKVKASIIYNLQHQEGIEYPFGEPVAQDLEEIIAQHYLPIFDFPSEEQLFIMATFVAAITREVTGYPVFEQDTFPAMKQLIADGIIARATREALAPKGTILGDETRIHRMEGKDTKLAREVFSTDLATYLALHLKTDHETIEIMLNREQTAYPGLAILVEYIGLILAGEEIKHRELEEGAGNMDLDPALVSGIAAKLAMVMRNYPDINKYLNEETIDTAAINNYPYNQSETLLSIAWGIIASVNDDLAIQAEG